MKTNQLRYGSIIILFSLTVLLFSTLNGNAQAKISTTGSLIVGDTVVPASKLDVEGGVSIGAGYSGTTAAPTNGAIIEGNVGIGTVAPTQKFDVNGDALIGASSRAAGHTFLFLDAGTVAGNEPHFRFSQNKVLKAQIKWSSDAIGGIDFYTVGTGSFVRFTNLGKAGFGTMTPASKLDVEGGISIGATYSGTTAAPANGAIIEGNVGIGITSPGDKLDVAGNVNLNAGTNAFKINGNKVLWHNGNTSDIFVGYNAGNTTMTGHNNTFVGFSVGVANTSGSSNSNFGNAALNSNTTGSNNTAIGFNSGGSNITGTYNTLVGYSANVNNSNLTNATAIGNGAVVTANNNMFFGNTNVVGWGFGVAPGVNAIRVGTNTTNGNGATLTLGGQWTNGSDSTKKHDIQTIPYGLQEVMKLRPVTFKMDSTNYQDIGFLAQEVKLILPEIVYGMPGEMTLSYAQITSVLTRAMQEQQQKIDSLKTKTTNQDSTNTYLQNSISQQDQTIDSLKTKTTSQDSLIATLQNQMNTLASMINSCCDDHHDNGNHNGGQREVNNNQIDVELNDAQSIVLEQNVPNPFAEQTSINYSLPDNTVKAQMLFYNAQGKLIQSTELTQKGKGALNVFASDLSNGIYTYTLVVDGKIIETRKMVKQ